MNCTDLSISFTPIAYTKTIFYPIEQNQFSQNEDGIVSIYVVLLIEYIWRFNGGNSSGL